MNREFAVWGPGRVGRALAHLWTGAGLHCRGFRGRDPERTARAAAAIGAPALADDADLRDVAIVLVAVSDPALAEVVARCAAAGAVGAGALWLHTSGIAGRDVLEPVAAQGGRTGAFHPLCPVPDVRTGIALLPGRRVLIEAQAAELELLEALAESAGLQAVVVERPFDRALYHAACALAANGGTALCAIAAHLVATATGLGPRAADDLVADLTGTAVRLCGTLGPRDALSGPVLRGDVATIAAHLAALADDAGATEVYTALARAALALARARGTDPTALERIARTLGRDRG